MDKNLIGLKEDASGFVKMNELANLVERLAARCLREIHLDVLFYISLEENRLKTLTTIVHELSEILRIPRSTLWYHVNFLKELGLIENRLGRPVKLTKKGEFILECMPSEMERGRK